MLLRERREDIDARHSLNFRLDPAETPAEQVAERDASSEMRTMAQAQDGRLDQKGASQHVCADRKRAARRCAYGTALWPITGFCSLQLVALYRSVKRGQRGPGYLGDFT